ncbi:hypothetical protein [Nitrosomonas ureae]|uniref:Uncharacterized protein n=1 Tax=Nitrosomonas ureae TaxID=44577 RepID=A0A1H9GYM1_9PROT|nr:hypothetical protein [Nitrosomonas ureae]SEQ55160.1 hypothetical protein SAMN05421510_10818 [Nitrosomonas ureae]
MDDLIGISILILVIVVLILGISLISERRRINRFIVKVDGSGLEFSVELRELVQREVNRATTETLHRIVALDKKLIEYWERESIHKHTDSESKLRLLEQNVTDLEQSFSRAAESEKPNLGFALREMYWQYLRQARSHYASSSAYQAIRARVLEGLSKLEVL